jgi:N6-L-threonylcarbamoyladenine synthase
MIILAVESSCDDTSVALLKDRAILSNVIFTQDHTKFGGVFPEQASREHLNNISLVYDQAMQEANLKLEDVDVIAATYAPGLVGSLLVGYSFAQGLSYGQNKTVFPVHHIKGHIYAAMLEHDVELPAISLVASGGHTSLILLDKDHNFQEIGCTLDDAVGEAYDKVGRMIGLSFPAGKEIDQLSQKGNVNIKMPVFQSDDYNFSFSGLKSFVFRYLQQNDVLHEDLAASFQFAVEESLIYKSIKAFKDFKARSFILSGGVAANSGLRKRFKALLGDKVYWPQIRLCLDNAAMIGAAAYFMIQNGKSEQNVRVRPSLKLK